MCTKQCICSFFSKYSSAKVDQIIYLSKRYSMFFFGHIILLNTSHSPPAHLSTERHWAVWRVVVSHLSWWRELLRVSSSAPHLLSLLSTLPPTLPLYTSQDIADAAVSEDQLWVSIDVYFIIRLISLMHAEVWYFEWGFGGKGTKQNFSRLGSFQLVTNDLTSFCCVWRWLSGALLTAGVEWGNENVTQQALTLFDGWTNDNETIPEIYQEVNMQVKMISNKFC